MAEKDKEAVIDKEIKEIKEVKPVSNNKKIKSLYKEQRTTNVEKFLKLANKAGLPPAKINELIGKLGD